MNEDGIELIALELINTTLILTFYYKEKDD